MPPPGSPAHAAMMRDATTARGGGGRPRGAVGPVMPARRGGSGTIPPAFRDAVPPPRPAPFAPWNVRRATVLEQARMQPGRDGVPGPLMARFRGNYRGSHRQRISPAQEAVMARFLYNRNPSNPMFGDM